MVILLKSVIPSRLKVIMDSFSVRGSVEFAGANTGFFG